MSLTQRVKDYDYHKNNQHKFNRYLKNERKMRNRNSKLAKIKEKSHVINHMIEKSSMKDLNWKDIGPFDADFWFNMNTGL